MQRAMAESPPFHGQHRLWQSFHDELHLRPEGIATMTRMLDRPSAPQVEQQVESEIAEQNVRACNANSDISVPGICLDVL